MLKREDWQQDEIRLNVSDVELIKKECYLIKNTSPELRRNVPQVSAYNQANRAVRGVWPEYQNFRSLKSARDG